MEAQTTKLEQKKQHKKEHNLEAQTTKQEQKKIAQEGAQFGSTNYKTRAEKRHKKEHNLEAQSTKLEHKQEHKSEHKQNKPGWSYFKPGQAFPVRQVQAVPRALLAPSSRLYMGDDV